MVTATSHNCMNTCAPFFYYVLIELARVRTKSWQIQLQNYNANASKLAGPRADHLMKKAPAASGTLQMQTIIGMQAECNRCGSHREHVFHIPLHLRITQVHAPRFHSLSASRCMAPYASPRHSPQLWSWSGRYREYMHKKCRNTRTSAWAVVTARFDMRILPKLSTNAHACKAFARTSSAASAAASAIIASYVTASSWASMATTYRIQPPALSYTLGNLRRLSPRWLCLYSLPHGGVHVQMGAPPCAAASTMHLYAPSGSHLPNPWLNHGPPPARCQTRPEDAHGSIRVNKKTASSSWRWSPLPIYTI